MKKLQFDPNGGDLGRGVRVSVLELAIVVPHIANILQALHHQHPDESMQYKYAFEISPNEKTNLLYAIEGIKLPSNVKWYSVDGRTIFEMRGASGGVVGSMICYLVTHD